MTKFRSTSSAYSGVLVMQADVPLDFEWEQIEESEWEGRQLRKGWVRLSREVSWTRGGREVAWGCATSKLLGWQSFDNGLRFVRL